MIVVDSVSTSDISDSNSDLSSHTPSDIPNIFQCTKEPSIIRGEKEKNPSKQVSLDNISDNDQISIDDEFNNSWDNPSPKNVQTTT